MSRLEYVETRFWEMVLLQGGKL